MIPSSAGTSSYNSDTVQPKVRGIVAIIQSPAAAITSLKPAGSDFSQLVEPARKHLRIRSSRDQIPGASSPADLRSIGVTARETPNTRSNRRGSSDRGFTTNTRKSTRKFCSGNIASCYLVLGGCPPQFLLTPSKLRLPSHIANRDRGTRHFYIRDTQTEPDWHIHRENINVQNQPLPAGRSHPRRRITRRRHNRHIQGHTINNNLATDNRRY